MPQLQTIQAGTAGELIPFTCGRLSNGVVSPIDFTGRVITVEVTAPSGAVVSYAAIVGDDPTLGQCSLETVTTMFTVGAGLREEEYQLQVVGTKSPTDVYRSPRATMLVKA